MAVTIGLAALVDTDVRAVAPILGVSLGDEADRSTWRIEFAPHASASQRAAAATVLAGFDLATVPARLAAQQADLDSAQRLIAATVAYIYRATHGGTNPTGAQLLTELQTWKAIYKALP